MSSLRLVLLAVSLPSTALFGSEPDPKSLPRVKRIVDGAQDDVRKNRRDYEEANDRVVKDTKKKLLAEATRLKEADQDKDAAAVTALAEDLNAVRTLVEGDPPADGGLAGQALPQGDAKAKGWVPLQPNSGVETLVIYPALVADKAVLKQHIDGRLQKNKGGRVAQRDAQGLYFVPNEPSAAFSALCAVRTHFPTKITVKFSGNDGEVDVRAAVNDLLVATGQQVTLPRGESLVHVLIQNAKGLFPAGNMWFRLDLEAEPGKVEVFVP